MLHRLVCICLPLFLTGLAALPAQKAAEKPVRVHIIGASVSGGFRDGPMFGAEEQGDSVTLQHVLKRWADGEARVTTHNTVEMMAFFTKPLEIGASQMKLVKRRKPDIIVAIDFPFWFAYGYMRGDESKARKQRLAKGLLMLADLEVPVLLGDLPDMKGAAGRMLSPAQIPSKELLIELNAQLAAFVKAHDNVRLVQLSDMVHRMRNVGIALPLEGGPVATPKGAMQQADRLHATRLGMAYLGFTLQGTLAGAFAEGHPLRQQKWTFEEFVEAAGAEDELEVLCEAVDKRE